MADITVPVPDDRIADFYQYFGLWLSGSVSLSELAPKASEASAEPASNEPSDWPAWGENEADPELAVALWRKYSPRARALFGLLMDNPGQEFTGKAIAKTLDIPNGRHGVAGVLAHPGRFAYKVQRPLPSDWRYDEASGESLYWMDEGIADIFKAARAEVEAGEA